MNAFLWQPRESFGPFRLGARIGDLVRSMQIEIDPSLNVPGVGLVSYTAKDGIRLEVREGRIESISSESSFYFRDKNLIGMDLSDVQVLLGVAPDSVDDVYDDESLQIADFDDLGLQICMLKNVVTSATCY